VVGRTLRIILIGFLILAVAAITVGAALLVESVELRPGFGPVMHLLAAVIMTALSGVGLAFLRDMIVGIWHLNTDTHFGEFLTKAKDTLTSPTRVVLSVLATGAVVAAGILGRSPDPGLEPGELTIMTAFPADAGDARSMLLDQWNRLNPDNRAEFDFAPLDAEGQHERMVDDAKDERRADIYVLDVVWMEEFASRGYIQPLDRARLPRDMGDFVPKIMQTCEFDGNLWALPFNSDVGLLYRRTGIPGIHTPENWEDYFGAAAKTAVVNARATHPGLEAANAAQLAVDDEMFTVIALEAIWAAGGRLVAPNGQLTLTPDGRQVDFGPADLMGIEKLAAATRDADITLTKDGEVFRTTAQVATQTFIDGRTAYMRNWPVERDVIGDQVSFDVRGLPEASVLGGQNLAISSSTDKPRAAQALIQFLTNSSSQLIISEVGGFVPTRQSAFDNSRRPDALEVHAALLQARLRPVSPNYMRCSKVFREGIYASFGFGGRLDTRFAEQLARACR
jgi:multiple sugar transport system substrate-binding protein